MQNCVPEIHSTLRRVTVISLTLGALLASAQTRSAPSIQQVVGTMDHKSSITISGSGFGSKSSAAPLVWDDASGADIHAVWDGAWPSKLGGYNMDYYAPMRGVSPPHGHDFRFLAGAHASNSGADAGYDVLVFKATTLPSFPCFIYASWYQRADSSWVFGGDNNFKTFDYAEGNGPYASHSWYTAYGPPHPASTEDSPQWTLETGTGLNGIDARGHNAWWGQSVNPMGGGWAKIEITVKVTDSADGFVSVVENGRKVVDYIGPTDTYAGRLRTIVVGGYARMQGHTSNWRYYDDIYLDTTQSRVVLADQPVLALATTIETQIPTAWNDGSITATVNLGRFSQGQKAYVFVVDASGIANATGFSVTAGGAASGAPSAPSAVAVQ